MRVLMMIHRQADNSPYCFYVHEQAKALRAQGHDVTVISCVGVMPMMQKLRPALAETDRRTPQKDVIDGIPVYFPALPDAGQRRRKGDRRLAALSRRAADCQSAPSGKAV